MPVDLDTQMRLVDAFAVPVIVTALILFVTIDRWRHRRRSRDHHREMRHPHLPRDSADDGNPDSPKQDYSVFTREHDRELSWSEVLDYLKQHSTDRWKSFFAPKSEWTAAVVKAAQFRGDWAGFPMLDRLRATAPDHLPVVTLLVDQSGSMRPDRIAAAAVGVEMFVNALLALGIRCEILGFSTIGWRGGHAAQQWELQGRPERPGRLCDLLHVVYKSVEEARWSPESQRVFLHPDILRENIDGEALEWAVDRLVRVEAPHRFLIILSDGAPVDDSTLLRNDSELLWNHLVDVVARIEQRDDVTLAAVGVDYAVDSLYARSRSGKHQALPEALADLWDVLAAPATARVARDADFD